MITIKEIKSAFVFICYFWSVVSIVGLLIGGVLPDHCTFPEGAPLCKNPIIEGVIATNFYGLFLFVFFIGAFADFGTASVFVSLVLGFGSLLILLPHLISFVSFVKWALPFLSRCPKGKENATD